MNNKAWLRINLIILKHKVKINNSPNNPVSAISWTYKLWGWVEQVFISPLENLMSSNDKYKSIHIEDVRLKFKI